ncbi:glycosyl transferase [Halovibrio salipaludis]|uniref:Glycosyl transferase n=1 Tax=Halovibrio salipaludis TaxID=2032626 RepID=A0A2A2F9N8_9GAMM|nr:glycosyl transferase [Halovibrio salipaludis]
MKVLHLIDSGGLYGAEKMLLALVSEQIKQGLEPMILSAGEPAIEEKPLEAEARRLGLPITPWRMKPGLNLPEARKIITWAREQGYDLMHSHGYKFNILAGIWPRRMRLPLVATLHGYVRAPRFTKMWLYELMDRLVLRRMQGVILVNEPMRVELESVLQGSKAHVIPNGVDIADIERRAEEEPASDMGHFLSTHSPVILGVGRLSREKAFERLIEAFAAIRDHYPQAGLLVVGEGKQRGELESLVQQYSLDTDVLMPGFQENVPALMARADALVIPSRTEGLPITLLEAMTLKLPVIASAVGAMPEVLENGENGWIVQEPFPESIRDSLHECLKNQEPRSYKVQKAYQKVHRIYSSRAMATAYSDIYQQVAG